MKIKLSINYTESFIPPRCRKPRQEIKEEIVPFSIRETTSDQAPIAFVTDCFGEGKRAIRLYKGNLYKEYSYRSDPTPEAISFNWEFYLLPNLCYDKSKSGKISLIKEIIKEWLIIDGKVYHKTGEPFYSVTTFGLGHNHGGTGLFVSYAPKGRKKLYGWNALQYKEAIEGAISIAVNRGDTKSANYLQTRCHDGQIEVHLPECIKRKYYNEHHLHS